MRVLLATDQTDLGDALRLYLSEHDVDVVGVAAETVGLVELARETSPDVIVVDSRILGAWKGTIDDLRGAERRGVLVLGASQGGIPAAAADADGYATVGDPPDALVAMIAEAQHVHAAPHPHVITSKGERP